MSVATDRLTELTSSIADNTVPGGSAYGRAAAEVIALTLAGSPDTGPAETSRALSEISTWLVDTKPSMTSIRTVTDLATKTLRETGSRPSVIQAMTTFIAESETSIARIADHADLIVANSTVLFHSYSGSLLQLLGRAAQTTPHLTYVFTESRPYRESRRVVAALAGSAVDFVGVSDAAMAAAAAEVDLVVVGADALFRDGSFANKIGSLPLALSARYAGTPYYVATELSKLYQGDPADVAMEQRPPEELADDWDLWRSGRVTVRNQFFERVPADLVTAYLTDCGRLLPQDLVTASTQTSEASRHTAEHPTTPTEGPGR